MNSSLKKVPLVKFLSSIKITVGCLFLLFVLTFWGTVAQVDQGLYTAQKKFFYSWFFLAFDFLPFPGARLVLWVLFINLLLNTWLRFVYAWSRIGIVIIHIGLLLYFLSAFVTFHVVKEANLTLLEGEGSNVAVAYHEWELSVWEKIANQPYRTVYAYDADQLQSGTLIPFANFFFQLGVQASYDNADAYTARDLLEHAPLNRSGITRLAPKPFEKEPEKNSPGLILEVRTQTGILNTILLYGAENQPTALKVGDRTLEFQLRRKRYPLPIDVELKKFHVEMHPGTEIAKTYESELIVRHQDLKTESRIYMNHPLRYGAYTFYQAAYSIDDLGQKRSTLAVVKNYGRWLPYITSLITFAGLALHFSLMGFSRIQKKNP